MTPEELNERLSAISADYLVEYDTETGVGAHMPDVEITYRPGTMYYPHKWFLDVHRSSFEGDTLEEVLRKAES